MQWSYGILDDCSWNPVLWILIETTKFLSIIKELKSLSEQSFGERFCTFSLSHIVESHSSLNQLYLVLFFKQKTISYQLQSIFDTSHSVPLDNSGIRVYYIKTLRPYDVGNVQIGQDNLFIPPRRPLTVQEGSCSGTCTRLRLPHPIYITRTYLHMHHLGERLNCELKIFWWSSSAINFYDVSVCVHLWSPTLITIPLMHRTAWNLTNACRPHLLTNLFSFFRD